MLSPFQAQYQGRFISALRWSQLDELWAALHGQPEGWYLYFIGQQQTPPQKTLSAAELLHFLNEVDALLRQDHEYDYCGIVYTDSFQTPEMIKIYDPNNLGASCGFSGKKIPPRWVLSRIMPESILDEAPIPQGRRQWWDRIFQR